ncbi:MAG: amidase, partial [Sphingomonadaceae bacterium]
MLMLAACTTPEAYGPSSISRDIANAGPAELETRAAIDRIKAYNPTIGAVIALNPDAIAQARAVDESGQRGPLAGVPVLIKDNIETADNTPTTAGSLALADNFTGRDSPLVAGLRDAGAIIVGKANLSEWANIRSSNSISGWSAIGGQVRNPWALDRNPCGSSSGSGAAVASGMVDHAVGTETNGSVACPAAINGIVGFKPTVGLISRRHIVPISVSQDTAGPMTRTVRQAADMLSAMAGTDPRDAATAEADARKVDYAAALDSATLAGKRFGVMRFASGFGTDERLEEAIELIEAQGGAVIDLTELDRGPIFQTQLGVLLTELKVEMNAYLATLPNAAPRSLAELISFNEANAEEEMSLFGQELFEQAEATIGYDDEYRANQQRGIEAAGPDGIDRLLAEHDLD